MKLAPESAAAELNSRPAAFIAALDRCPADFTPPPPGLFPLYAAAFFPGEPRKLAAFRRGESVSWRANLRALSPGGGLLGRGGGIAGLL